jgi:hypothetical protein
MADKKKDTKPIDKKTAAAKKKWDAYVGKKLKKANYQDSESTYVFEFDNKAFEFRIPTIFEKTKIKAILASITRFPGANLTTSSQFDIYSSGDLDLMYSTKAITHTSVLMNNPTEFDPETFGEEKIYGLGELITFAENKFHENKKKQSTK